MFKLLDLSPHFEHMRDHYGFFEDFDNTLDSNVWTTTAPNTGTATVSDAQFGILTMTPSTGTATDNDEIYVCKSMETFDATAENPLIVECRLNYTEQNTDDANVIFGIMDGVGANTLLDNGAGPAASYSGAVFFKVDGDTVWQAESSVGSTQTTTQLTAAISLDGQAQTAGGGVDEVLRIEVRPHGGSSGTLADICFWKDGVLVAKHKDVTISSFTEAQLVLGIKNGGTGTPESLAVDYAFGAQRRTAI